MDIMKKLSLFVLVLFSLIFIHKVSASSIMGSDLSWSYIGQDSFLIKLVVYSDCNGDQLNPPTVLVSCNTNGNIITSIHFIPGTPVDITPICCTSCTRCQSAACSFPYGIHRYTMQSVLNLSKAGICCNIKLSWQQCCRNMSITTGAGGKNFYTEAILNRCQHPCDNSSTFTEAPVSILCVDREYVFLQGADDIDRTYNGFHRDSIVYENVPPLQSATDSIPYTGQYSSTNPFYFDGFPYNKPAFPKGFHVIKETGDIQFKPKKAEVSVMTLKVSEFRDGVHIGEQRREMEFITILCTDNQRPTVKSQNNIMSKSICVGTPMGFSFFTNDSDIYDSVTISWNNSIPGAIWSTSNGQSKHPTYGGMDQ
jgi:hypothetical protein